MSGITPITAKALSILVAAGAVPCEMPKATQINIIPRSAEIEYDYSLSLAQMQAESVDTIDPFGFHAGKSITNGYTTSPVTMQPVANIEYKPLSNQRSYCIWYDSIDINIEVSPKITIAREVYLDQCLHEAVLGHEMKHVMETRRVINKYTNIMAEKIYKALKQRGFSVGPIAEDKAQEVLDRMHQTVYKIAEFEFKKMELDHQERQMAIDSLVEYESIGEKCRSFDYNAALKSPY